MYDNVNVQVTLPVVTVSDVTIPRWMTPFAKPLFAIPTHMTMQERLLLFQTAIALPPAFTIVEIGSYLGASTAFLGFAAWHRGGSVHAVDPWTNDAMGAEGARDTWGEFRKNTAPFEHFITPHHGFSVDVHRAGGDIPCDMLFVDGDHGYEAVIDDLQHWLPSLRPGGVLAMHDVDAPTVRRAFDEIVSAEGCEAPPHIIDRLLVCRPKTRVPA